MFRAWRLGLLLVLASGIAFVSSARATVMIELSTEQLAARATAVVRGTVERQQVVEHERGLWTESYVRVTERLKGSFPIGALMHVRQPGGELNGRGERVAGAARLEVGEDVLLLVRPVGRYHVPVGMCLGKFRLVLGQDGQVHAERDLRGVTLVDANGRGRVRPGLAPTPRLESRPLAELRSELARAFAGATRGGAR